MSIPPPRACRRVPDVDSKLLAWGRASAARDRGWCSFPHRHPRARPGDLDKPNAATGPGVRPGDDGVVGRGDHVGCNGVRIPTLWLFTDSKRLPDLRASVARLPYGRAGVVFRHDDHPDRVRLCRDIARICRARRLLLVIAGDVRLAAAVRAGVHLRGGRWPGPARVKGLVTSSAHNLTDLHRAARAGARLAFLAPVFVTRSHPGAPSLGPTRWSALARAVSIPVAALGGVDGVLVRGLPAGLCRAVGAIGALA